MTQTAPQERYTSIAMTLHWLVAILLGLMIALGKNMENADGRPIEWMFQLHKSVGITILVLMIARLIWRFSNKPPALPNDMKPFEKRVSHWVHLALYILVFAMPISGWIMVSASPFAIATILYGAVSWPHIPGLAELALETRQSIYPNIANVHELMSWALIALFALHVIGAIKHEVTDEEGVLKRMIPGLFGKTTPPRAPAKGSLTAFGSAALFFGLIAGGPVIAQAVKAPAPAAIESALEANWAVDYAASEIRFSGIHDGNEFTGVFEKWTADINWNDDTLDTNRVAVTVETGSVLTGKALYDNTIDAAEWFNTGVFPNATVVLSSFTATDTGYTSDAAITLKNNTVTVPFVFTLANEGDDATMTGAAKLSREAFDLGQESDSGGDWVSLDIDVAVTVKASRTTS